MTIQAPFLLSSIILLYFTCRAEEAGECDRSNCNYHGVCIRSPENNATHCICIYGFNGPNCEISSCRCLNGGKCQQSSSRVVCNCPPGFSGNRCEMLVQSQHHICYDFDLCGKNGKCIPNSSSYKDYHCECNRGFEGDRCQNCSAGFTGENCQFERNECLRKPCARGRCVKKGDSYFCECPKGFKGKNCAVAIDPCFNSLCKNQAKCVVADGTYFCQCQPGFTGRFCDFHIETCPQDYCKNGGKCVPTIYGTSCICSAGFTGSRCEEETDICGYNSSVCLNGGTCINRNDKYSCICVSGWEGRNCEINVDDCADAFCAEGSKCVDRVASYFCECPLGKTGTFCNLSDPCLSNPCKEGSECLVNSANGEYQCKCQNGYTGRDCSVDIDECVVLNITCGNNGTCVNTRGSWRCECDEGFSGAFCATTVERCSPNPCLNGGSCLDYRFRGECVCIGGFYGERCEKKCPDGFIGKNCELQKCNDSTCLNGGLCVSGICRCLPQFVGNRCQSTVSNPCESNPCFSNEVCKPSANGIDYVCECEPGFSGPNCRQKLADCVLNPCQHGGTCVDTFGGYICRCQPGYYGHNCEENYDDCKHNPCLNGGTCIDGVNTFSCHCPISFTGELCDVQMLSPCENNFCKNNATCIPTSDFKHYKCECSNGFKGAYCDDDVDECRISSSCQNGATCQNTFGSYNCACPTGFFGKSCEYKRENCLSNSCFNGGRCVEMQKTFNCECLAGFTGPQCENNVDDCEKVTCKNGGTCHDQINNFTCHCRLGFSGRWCERNDDDCRPGLCLNNGTCIDGVNSYQCECMKGYTGKNCQVKVDFEEYIRTDILDKEVCKKNRCEEKAEDGVCDDECNFFACQYDGGDCSAKNQPFKNCAAASFCAHNFYNNRCDQICNNEECLFDGYDCDTIHERCHRKSFCSKVFSDGKCDSDCNNSGCGWDGGDCNKSGSSKLNGNVILVLLVHPQEFIKRMKLFLLTLSQALRASISIKMEDGKPLIYEWNSLDGIGSQIDVPKQILYELSSNHSRWKRDDEKLVGTMVVLIVDIMFCLEDDHLKCFSDIASVANYLGAVTAKQLLPDLDMRLYSATAELASENKTSVLSNSIIISFLFALAFIGVLFLMVQQGRKRKLLNAPIWRPPLNESGKSSSTNIDTFTIQSGFHYSEFGSSKRMRTDLHHSSFFIPEDTQSFLSHTVEKCQEDERQWTILHEEAMLKSPIITPIKSSLVNAKGKYGRTALMLVILNENKDDMVVQEDIESLLGAGAEIDLSDDDETTPLMFAVKKARLSVVRFLLKKGANAGLADSQHRTILHHAVAIDYPDMVHLLLETDVNVNAWDCNNQTALIYAARFAFHPNIVEELLQANADPSCTGDKSSIEHTGRTALHFAAQCNNLEVIQALIHHGANKDAQDQQEQTPLFLAALEGKFSAVKLLISLGATKDICDQKERSPRDVAAERKYHEIVAFLDTICSQRAPPSNFNGNTISFGGQLVRQKKSNKKSNPKSVKKILPANLPSNTIIHSNVNPLTPPLSDGSNYSTTPSPNDVHPSVRATSHLGLFENSLQTSSVMLSPQFETCSGAGWSPQENSSCMINGTGMWKRVDFPYDERCFAVGDQGPASYQYQYPQVQHSTGYCNV